MFKKRRRKKLEEWEKFYAELFKTEKAKEILDENEKKMEEEFRTKTGWFSPEEDKAWEFLNKED